MSGEMQRRTEAEEEADNAAREQQQDAPRVVVPEAAAINPNAAVMYLQGTDDEMKEMFPFGGPVENMVYGLACVEVKDVGPDRDPAEAGITLAPKMVRGVRLALVGIASFKKKPAIATPGGLIVPAH